MYAGHDFLDESCPDAAYHVVEQEPLRPPYLLEDASEHPHGKHVEKHVQEAAVHEHVGDELCGVEPVGQDEVQPQVVAQVDAIAFGGQRGQIHQHVDDKQVLGDSR